MIDSYKAGTLLVLTFLIMANANAVFSGWLLQSVSPFTLIFWGFLSTSIFFGSKLALFKGKSALNIPKKSYINLVSLNIASGISWIGYYFALRSVEPAIASALMGCIGPLYILAINFYRKESLLINQIVTSIGIALGTAILSFASIFDYSAVQNTSSSEALLGLAAAFMGGVGQVITTLSTKRLVNQGWGADGIMAHRFYFLIVVAFFFAIENNDLIVRDHFDFFAISVVSFFGILLPLWILQKGIILSSPFTVSVLLSLGPLITLLFQSLDSRLVWSNITILGCSVIVISSINNFIYSHKK